MNFFGFGKSTPRKEEVKAEEVKTILNLIDKPIKDVKDYFINESTIMIDFDRDQYEVYFPISFQQFLINQKNPLVAGNLRPQILEIYCNNKNTDVCENCEIAFTNAPLLDDYVNNISSKKFPNKTIFSKEVYINVEPYLTQCYSNSINNDTIDDIGINQIVNVNIIPNKQYNLCLGGIYLNINRKKSDPMQFEFKFVLKSYFKSYFKP